MVTLDYILTESYLIEHLSSQEIDLFNYIRKNNPNNSERKLPSVIANFISETLSLRSFKNKEESYKFIKKYLEKVRESTAEKDLQKVEDSVDSILVNRLNGKKDVNRIIDFIENNKIAPVLGLKYRETIESVLAGLESDEERNILKKYLDDKFKSYNLNVPNGFKIELVGSNEKQNVTVDKPKDKSTPPASRIQCDTATELLRHLNSRKRNGKKIPDSDKIVDCIENSSYVTKSLATNEKTYSEIMAFYPNPDDREKINNAIANESKKHNYTLNKNVRKLVDPQGGDDLTDQIPYEDIPLPSDEKSSGVKARIVKNPIQADDPVEYYKKLLARKPTIPFLIKTITEKNKADKIKEYPEILDLIYNQYKNSRSRNKKELFDLLGISSDSKSPSKKKPLPEPPKKQEIPAPPPKEEIPSEVVPGVVPVPKSLNTKISNTKGFDKVKKTLADAILDIAEKAESGDFETAYDKLEQVQQLLKFYAKKFNIAELGECYAIVDKLFKSKKFKTLFEQYYIKKKLYEDLGAVGAGIGKFLGNVIRGIFSLIGSFFNALIGGNNTKRKQNEELYKRLPPRRQQVVDDYEENLYRELAKKYRITPEEAKLLLENNYDKLLKLNQDKTKTTIETLGKFAKSVISNIYNKLANEVKGLAKQGRNMAKERERLILLAQEEAKKRLSIPITTEELLRIEKQNPSDNAEGFINNMIAAIENKNAKRLSQAEIKKSIINTISYVYLDRIAQENKSLNLILNTISESVDNLSNSKVSLNFVNISPINNEVSGIQGNVRLSRAITESVSFKQFLGEQAEAQGKFIFNGAMNNSLLPVLDLTKVLRESEYNPKKLYDTIDKIWDKFTGLFQGSVDFNKKFDRAFIEDLVVDVNSSITNKQSKYTFETNINGERFDYEFSQDVLDSYTDVPEWYINVATKLEGGTSVTDTNDPTLGVDPNKVDSDPKDNENPLKDDENEEGNAVESPPEEDNENPLKDDENEEGNAVESPPEEDDDDLSSIDNLDVENNDKESTNSKEVTTDIPSSSSNTLNYIADRYNDNPYKFIQDNRGELIDVGESQSSVDRRAKNSSETAVTLSPLANYSYHVLNSDGTYVLFPKAGFNPVGYYLETFGNLFDYTGTPSKKIKLIAPAIVTPIEGGFDLVKKGKISFGN